MSHRGGGVRKVPKKCHVLFEWPLRNKRAFYKLIHPNLLMKFILGDFIRFEPVTLIPFETKLIDFGMMSTAQIEWFNEYNVKIREEVATILQVIQADCWHLLLSIAFTKHTNVITLKCDAMNFQTKTFFLVSMTEVYIGPVKHLKGWQKQPHLRTDIFKFQCFKTLIDLMYFSKTKQQEENMILTKKKTLMMPTLKLNIIFPLLSKN